MRNRTARIVQLANRTPPIYGAGRAVAGVDPGGEVVEGLGQLGRGEVAVAYPADRPRHEQTGTAVAGGSEAQAPADYGFMYQRQLTDPDGHLLELGYMDPAAAQQGPEAVTSRQG